MIVGNFLMGAHNAGARRDTAIQHPLHDSARLKMTRQPQTITLPVASRPLGFLRRQNFWNCGEQFLILRGKDSALGDHLRHALELLASYGCLNVGHPIIVTDAEIGLEDHLFGIVPRRIRNTHAMLTKEPELPVPIRVRCCDHSAIACGEEFARMKGETRHIAMRFSNLFPIAIPQNFAPQGARRIFDDREMISARDRRDLI